MAHATMTTNCLASLARLCLSAPVRPSTLASVTPIARFPLHGAARCVRHASGGAGGMRRPTKKKKTYKTYRMYDLSDMTQFSLCDAMRYLRAVEVGQPDSVKYEMALKLKSTKNGPVVRNRLRLPHPIKSDFRVAVICPEGPMADEARQLGAVAAGEDSLFAKIRAGEMEFNRLVCHSSSEKALKKQNLGRILGPKGLMPSLKTKTITNNLGQCLDDLIGTDEYRERLGVVRMTIGRLSFTPRQLADNVKAVVASVKQDINNIEEKFKKAMDELVLSTTNGPGLSLSGGFNPTDEGVKPEHLEGPM